MQNNELSLLGAMLTIGAMSPLNGNNTGSRGYYSSHDPERKKKKEKNRAKNKRAKASRKRNRK